MKRLPVRVSPVRVRFFSSPVLVELDEKKRRMHTMLKYIAAPILASLLMGCIVEQDADILESQDQARRPGQVRMNQSDDVSTDDDIYVEDWTDERLADPNFCPFETVKLVYEDIDWLWFTWRSSLEIIGCHTLKYSRDTLQLNGESDAIERIVCLVENSGSKPQFAKLVDDVKQLTLDFNNRQLFDSTGNNDVSIVGFKHGGFDIQDPEVFVDDKGVRILPHDCSERELSGHPDELLNPCKDPHKSLMTLLYKLDDLGQAFVPESGYESTTLHESCTVKRLDIGDL